LAIFVLLLIVDLLRRFFAPFLPARRAAQ